MPLINLVITLIVVGVLLYLLNIAPFIDGTMKQVIRWVVIVCVALFLLSLFVPLNIPNFHVGR